MSEGQKTLKHLLKESFDLFRENWQQFAVVTLLVYVPLQVFIVLYFVFFGIGPIGVTKTMPPQKALVYLILSLCSIIFYLIYQIAIVRTIDSAKQKTNLSIASAYQEAFSLLGPYLAVVLRVALRVILWTFLLVVPGIVFGIFYSFANMAFLLDGKKGYGALVSSKQLVKPFFWKLIGNSLVAALILIPVYIMIGALTTLFFGTYTPEDANLPSVIGLGVANIVNAVVSTYLFVFFYFLYQEFKKRAGSPS